MSFYFIGDKDNDIPQSLIDKKPLGDFTAYVCEGFNCLEPIKSFDALIQELSKK